MKMIKKVLVPVDLQDTKFSLGALNIALREVEENGCELHIITVLPGYNNAIVASYFSEEDHKAGLKKAAQSLLDFVEANIAGEIKPALKVYDGSAAEKINRYVRDKGIDLVVMRAHQRSKVSEFFLGSVASRVVERAKCSVYILKD
jgi:universal stress protein F